MRRIVSRIELLTSTISDELSTITHSIPIVLVMLGGVVMYGFLYNFLYRPNVVRQAPIVVVDDSASPLSHKIISLLDGAPEVEVVGQFPNFYEARQAMANRRAVGIVYLPAELQVAVEQGKSAPIVIFSTTEQFLYYEAVERGVMGVIEAVDSDLRPIMTEFIPEEDIAALLAGGGIEVVGQPLYNPTRGYADYLMPAVLIAILFQTMVMAIALSTGSQRRSGNLLRHAQRGIEWREMATVVISRSVVYVVLYGIFATLLLGLLPHLFGLPDKGSVVSIAVLVIPYLIATSFAGQALGVLFRDGDAALLAITYFSVGLILLSGISYPLELMPIGWQVAHTLLPAPTAILAYVKASSMGAPPAECATQLYTLWGQAVVYFLLATATLRHRLETTIRHHQNQ